MSDCTHREKGLDNVSLDRAEGFVSDENEDLLLFLQTDEVPKPGPLGQSANGPVSKKKKKRDYRSSARIVCESTKVEQFLITA